MKPIVVISFCLTALVAIFVLTYIRSPLKAPQPVAASVPVETVTHPPTRLNDLPDFRPRLRLLSTRMEQVTDSNAAIHGEIVNISGDPFPMVKIVATVYDRTGRILTVGWALAESKPLYPGQRSPFTVWVSVADAGRFRITLETAADEPIPFSDEPDAKN